MRCRGACYEAMATASTEKLVRAVGFWGLVAMCINAVVGSGVFLLPTESYDRLGPFSLWAPLLFAVPVSPPPFPPPRAGGGGGGEPLQRAGGRVPLRAHRVRRLRRLRDRMDELDRAPHVARLALERLRHLPRALLPRPRRRRRARGDHRRLACDPRRDPLRRRPLRRRIDLRLHPRQSHPARLLHRRRADRL